MGSRRSCAWTCWLSARSVSTRPGETCSTTTRRPSLLLHLPPPRAPRKAPPPPPPRPKPPPRAEVKQPKAKPPYPEFKYLGYLGPKDRRIAVFEHPAADEAPILARVGDVVQEHFRLLEFRYEKVVFGYTDKQWDNRTAELDMETN